MGRWREGREISDESGVYIVYMQGFLAELERAAYELIDRIEDEQKEERNGV